MNYPYCQFDFDAWNPMQEKCVPHFTEDCNLVVSASMASGKTAIAEAIIGYELRHGKCLYVSPLRSIGAEKYDKWKLHPTFSQCKILLLDGDHHPEQKELEEAEIVIPTVESLDIALRGGSEWLKDVSVLVVDEAHMIGDESRGRTLEHVLMSFTELNVSSRLVLLSGTLPNTREIAVWVKSLNGKPTSFVKSAWRPTTLFTRIEMAEGFGASIKTALKEIKASKGKKTLVFVHSKKMGEELKKELKKNSVKAAFFSSEVDEERRTTILNMFKSPYSGLDVLVSTSSLAMGVNV